MYPIEVDFEVYKQLTVRRETEDITYNDVIRDLLGLKEKTSPSTNTVSSESLEDWVVKGVRFAAGTEFRAIYKGKSYSATVKGGALMLNGELFDSPSAAAMSVTDSAVNGWRFWECRLPNKTTWQLIESLRRK